MGLKDLVEAASSVEGSLKNIIKLRLVEEKVVFPLKADGYVRVSSLASICPREEVLAALTEMTRKDSINADLSLIFAHGKGLHYALQNEVLPDIGVLYGIWRCVECAKQFGQLTEPIASSQTLVRRPSKCDSCGCADFLYREQHFTNHEFRISGHPDGFIALPGFPGLGIVECKSINSRRAWEIRGVPDMGHAIQTQCYMWLTGLKWGKILYWDKGGMGAASLIEHTVEYDENTVAEIKSALKSIWKGLDDGPLPERICETDDCPRAQKCQLTGPCFSEKYSEVRP